MIMICNNCGATFEDDEFVTETQCVGECWGQPAYESFSVAPCCGEYDCREAHCEDCAHAVPYKPEEYDDAYTCDLDNNRVDQYDEACSSFELKEVEQK